MKKASEWFDRHKKELISDLCDLVRIPSVSRKTKVPLMPYGEDCRKVLDCMLSKGRRDGFITHDYEGYCGSIVFGGEEHEKKTKTIGIFGHLDVVEAGDGWSHDPFSPAVKGGIVSGRGAADDKGSLLSAYYALKYLKSNGYRPQASFFFFLGLNEEKEMEDIDYFLSKYREPDFSIVTDIFFPVCIGEKGVMNVKLSAEKQGEELLWFRSGVSENAVPGEAAMKVCLDEKVCSRLLKSGAELIEADHKAAPEGKKAIVIKCRGKGAHAAFPEGSENAMIKLAELLIEADAVHESDLKILTAVRDLFSGCYGEGLGIKHRDQVFGDITAVGTTFSYDGTTMEISVNIRYGSETASDIILKKMEQKITSYGFRIDAYTDRAPFYRDPGQDASGIIKAINETACRQLGICREPYVLSGGTYAKKLQRAVGFGPDYPERKKLLPEGYGGGHQPDEYIDVRDIKKAFLIYVGAFQEMDRRI